MGIRSLDSYVTKRTKNVRKATNILNAAEETLRSKVLVIDLNCVLRSSYSNLSLINGGDFAMFQNRWKAFLKKLDMAQIRPIFVIDGPTCVDKRETWISRFNNFLYFITKNYCDFTVLPTNYCNFTGDIMRVINLSDQCLTESEAKKNLKSWMISLGSFRLKNLQSFHELKSEN